MKHKEQRAEHWMAEAFEPDLVSVIIPTYNRADLIGETLESVRKQTHRPIEIVVVDDGSTDNTQQVVESFTRTCDEELQVRYVHQENQGALAARNRALLESCGEFIQFLDSDDLLAPEKLSMQVRVMQEKPEADYVFSRWQRIAAAGPPAPARWPKDFEPTRACLIDSLLSSREGFDDILWTTNGLYRRPLCLRTGPWDERIPGMHDRLYNMKALLCAGSVEFVPETHASYRLHEGEQWHKGWNPARYAARRTGWKEMERLLREAGEMNRRRRDLLAASYLRMARACFRQSARPLGMLLVRDALDVGTSWVGRARAYAIGGLYASLGPEASERLLARVRSVVVNLKRLSGRPTDETSPAPPLCPQAMSDSMALPLRGSEPLVSAVICTYNRPRELKVALESLEKQTEPQELFEVIVVDNGPFRSTRELVGEFRSRLPLRYVVERKTGLDHARNCGFREAAAEYVAYLDDDSRPTENWVEEICKLIRSGNAPAAFGGPCPPYYRVPKPEWYHEEYRTFDLGREARRIQGSPYLIGANLIVRQSVLRELGGFSADLDMNGTRIAYGGDSELQTRIVRRGSAGEVWYLPQLIVHHLVDPARMTVRWVILSKWKHGLASARMRSNYENAPLAQAAWYLGLNLLRALAYTPYLGNHLLGLRLHIGDIGKWVETVRLKLAGKWRGGA